MNPQFTTDQLLSLFLSIHLALLSSLGLFKTFRRLFPNSFNFRQWSKIARLIFFVSVMASAVIYLPPFRPHQILWRDVPQLMESYGRREMIGTGPRSSRSEIISTAEIIQAQSPKGQSVSVTWNEFIFFLLSTFIFLSLLRCMIQVLRLAHFLKHSVLLHKIGRVSVMTNEFVSIPFAVSLGTRNWVVIPYGLLSERRDLSVALAHELQHIRQGDTQFTVLIDSIGAILSPSIYFWKIAIIELQELSCDEALIGQNKVSSQDYGSCLVRVAEAALRKGSLNVGTTCMAADPGNPKRFKSFLRRRIEMFSEYPRQRPNASAIALVGTTLVLGCTLISLMAGASLRPSALPPLNSGNPGFDPEIEKIAQAVLTQALKDHPAQSAFAVIAEPASGRVLAAVSVGELKELPTSHLIEPASTLKTLLLAEGIQSKQFSMEDQFDCAQGNYKVGDHIHHDWKPFGELTARRIVTSSSNIGGIKLAEKLGVTGIQKLWNDFGFGRNGSAQDFPGARVGYLAPAETEKGSQWLPLTGSGVETLYTSPLEVVQAYSSIANGGLLMKAIPFSADASQSQVLRRVLSPENAKLLKDVLVEAATIGSGARHGLSQHYSSAGKTGTAYDPKLKEHESKFGGDESVAHYVGFAPLEQPRVTIYIGIIGTKESPTGSYMAAPVFSQMTDQVLKEMKVQPDLEGFSSR